MSKGEDLQQPNKQGQYYHTKSEKRVNSVKNAGGIEHHQISSLVHNSNSFQINYPGIPL